MIEFTPIQRPNLPENTVCHAVISGEYPQFADALQKLGVTTFLTKQCSDVLPQISYHADIVFAHLENNEFIIENSQTELKHNLTNIGFKLCDEVKLNANYPGDVILNNCLIDDKLICGKNVIHQSFFRNKKKIKSSQGYAKCSVCVVDKHSIITDDESIFQACESVEIDALLVKKGSVILPGFNYGFIGGCSGKISSDCLAFCGDIRTHDDYQKIKEFLQFRNIDSLSLCSGQLTDIGSIIPITEIIK